MLRWVIALLMLANAGYFLWTQGHLAPLGLTPAEEREPERLQGQIRPEVQRLLNAPRDTVPPAPTLSPAQAAPEITAPEAPTIEAPSPEPREEPTAVTPESTPSPAPAAPLIADSARACWQAGAFSGWRLLENRSNARWIVYLGRYNSAEQLDRKRAELRALKVDFRTVSAPGLAPGLALGTFSNEVSAQQALQKLVRDGIRTARVAQERAESLNFTLRLPAATSAQRDAVANLGAPLAGETLQACE
jgi:cell division protein FtsN